MDDDLLEVDTGHHFKILNLSAGNDMRHLLQSF